MDYDDDEFFLNTFIKYEQNVRVNEWSKAAPQSGT
jgi:hypothetical protein